MVLAQTWHISHLYIDKFIETYKNDRCALFRFAKRAELLVEGTYNIGMDATYDIYVLENILGMMTI